MIQDDSGDSELLQKTRMGQENYKSTGFFYFQLLHKMVCLVIVMVGVWCNVPPLLADTVSTGDK